MVSKYGRCSSMFEPISSVTAYLLTYNLHVDGMFSYLSELFEIGCEILEKKILKMYNFMESEKLTCFWFR